MALTRTVTAATTRAAFVALAGLAKDESAVSLVSDLRNRGYNTLIVPLMEEGCFHARRKGRGARARLAGRLADALIGAGTQKRTSIWLGLDLLAAGPRGSGELARLADDHREWLIRNTRGRLLPVGREETDPLFSWMNVIYRRFLADHLVSLLEAYPITGVVIDLRRYPGVSHDEGRWYCCSFQSQFRAENALGVGFERLLYEGTQRQIRDWQNWTLSELQAFIEYLAARVRTARFDVSWKLLVPSVESTSPGDAPWVRAVSSGVIDELIIEHDPVSQRRLADQIAAIDMASGREVPIMPAFRDEQAMSEGGSEFLAAPCPGYTVMRPGRDPEPAMPDAAARWERGGALEDDPLAAAQAIAMYLADEFQFHPAHSTVFEDMKDALAYNQPEWSQIERMREDAVTVLDKLRFGGSEADEAKRGHLRDISLLVRLLGNVRLPVAFSG